MILGFIGFLSGVISGMGIGGGTILIPALIIIAQTEQHEAQIINLIYFIPTAVIALIYHKKNNNIETKVLKPLILFGFIGAVAGSLLAVNLDSEILKKIFGIFLFLMGITEVLKKDVSKKDISKK